MNENISTKELYEQLQSRIIVNDLKIGEIVCSDCKGMHFTYRQEGESGYINSCSNCYNGRVYICKHCGKQDKTDHCNCKKASDERSNKWKQEQIEKDFIAYQKAEKINYKDYNGYYFLPNSERLQEIDDVGEWITDKLLNNEDPPEYLWAVEPVTHVSINLKDVISNECEDGYDDMYDFLDTESELLSQAQELINQWEKEQGDNLCVFSETNDKAIIITDLIEEIRNELKK